MNTCHPQTKLLYNHLPSALFVIKCFLLRDILDDDVCMYVGAKWLKNRCKETQKR